MFSRFIHLIAWIHITFLYSFLWLNINLHIGVYVCAQSCPNLCDPVDCNSPGSTDHGIAQARILEWVTIFFFRGSSRSRDPTWVSCSSVIGRQILYHWATCECHILIGLSQLFHLLISGWPFGFFTFFWLLGKYLLWTSMLLCGHAIWASLRAQLVKNLPAMRETLVEFLRRDRLPTQVFLGFPCGSAGKESTCNAGDLGLIPGLGRSPGEGKGSPLQYSGLENSSSTQSMGSQRVRQDWATLHFTLSIYLGMSCGFTFNLLRNDQAIFQAAVAFYSSTISE